MPKQINTYQVGQKLVRLFGLKGRYQPVLDETIVPVIDVGLSPIERGAMAGGTIAAVAAEFPYILVTNPLGSGLELELTRAAFQSDNASQVMVSCPAFAVVLGSAAAAIEDWRDASRPGTPAAVVTVGVHAGAITGAYRWQTGSTGRDCINGQPLDIIVPAGTDCIFVWGVANTNAQWGLEWTERNTTEG